jgi:hypothetical protein
VNFSQPLLKLVCNYPIMFAKVNLLLLSLCSLYLHNDNFVVTYFSSIFHNIMEIKRIELLMAFQPVYNSLSGVSGQPVCFIEGNCIEHSCYPTLGISCTNKLFYLPSVQSHHQPTLDFSTLFMDAGLTAKCNCGFNGCRKVILGFNLLPVYFQNKYLQLDAVPGFIRNAVLY